MSTPAEIRAQAAQLLIQVAEQGKSLDVLLENRSDAPAERGLLRSLCYGSVRWYWRIYAVLEQLSSQPVRELQPEVRALALVGLYQLLHTDIAAHAAVAETVEATRVLNVGRAAGFLNAILRRCQREVDSLTRAVDQHRAASTAHPRWLVEALQEDWPWASDAMLAANNLHPPFWLRVNVQRISRDDYMQQLAAMNMQALPSAIAPEALYLPEAVDVGQLPGFKEGLVSVQDGAAQLAAHLLGAQPGERILDACAAPGGKTCHILELQPELAEMVALDVSKVRLKRVQGNLLRLGLNATVIGGDAATQAWWHGELFDRILLDAPCSATGVIRRHPDIKLLRRGNDIGKLAERQQALLINLWPLLKPGGRLLYASCSLLRAENADNVAQFLDEHSDARDVTSDLIDAMPEPSAWYALQPEGRPVADRPGLIIQTGKGACDESVAMAQSGQTDTDTNTEKVRKLAATDKSGDRRSDKVTEGGFDGFYYACLEKR